MTLRKSQGIPAIVALRGLDNICPNLEARYDALRATILERLATAGLGFADIDLAVWRRLSLATPMSHIYGFGAKLGGGHLNAFGHRIYADVVTELVQGTIHASGRPPLVGSSKALLTPSASPSTVPAPRP